MNKKICPNQTCLTRNVREWEITSYQQGELCEKCSNTLDNDSYQKITCNSCGAIYLIRLKIRDEEDSYIERGVCDWCFERKKEEDKLIKEGRMTEEERVKPINMNRVINNIFNKPKLE